MDKCARPAPASTAPPSSVEGARPIRPEPRLRHTARPIQPEPRLRRSPRLRHTDVDRLPGSGANNSTFGPQRVHANVPLKLPKFERVLTREQNNARRYLGREYDARAWIAPDSPATTATAVIIPSVGKQTQSQRRNTLFRVRNHPEIREPGHAREPRADPGATTRRPRKVSTDGGFQSDAPREACGGARDVLVARDAGGGDRQAEAVPELE